MYKQCIHVHVDVQAKYSWAKFLVGGKPFKMEIE